MLTRAQAIDLERAIGRGVQKGSVEIKPTLESIARNLDRIATALEIQALSVYVGEFEAGTPRHEGMEAAERAATVRVAGLLR